MVSIDTNVIVRLLTRDEEDQYARALNLFDKNEIFLPITVLLETEWVLRYAYQFKPEEICDAFLKLCGLRTVHLSDPHTIFLAIEWHRKGLDFADAVHLSSSRQHNKFYSFDARLMKMANRLSSCKVLKP